MNSDTNPPGSGAQTGTPRGVRSSLLNALLVVAIFCTLLALLAPFIIAAREDARRMQSQNNVQNVCLAMHNYHDALGSFPPASECDSTGATMHSWRALIVPYVDGDDFMKHYDRLLPWNSPGNDALCQQIRLGTSIYNCPGNTKRDPNCTSFIAITGPGTLFPGDRMVKITEVMDGTSNTLMIAEIDHSDILWHEPRDLEIDKMSFRISDPDRSKPCIGNRYHRGAIVGMLDGSVHFLPEDTPPETLKAMLTIAGGEDVIPPTH